MHAAVQKYAMLEDPDIQVKQWISMVRELAYDIEDSIDKFIHRLGNGGCHGDFKEFFRKAARSPKTLGARHGIAGQIEELKARIKQVKELKYSYKLDAATCSASSNIAIDPRLSALFADEGHLVGIDGPRDDLIKWIVDEGNNTATKHRSVLSIVGFGGLGKTTLANQVYRKIGGYFDCLAFVSVSQKPDIKKIMNDVISQVSCQDGSREGTTDNWDESKFVSKLRELLKDKRYLIIIDDIWCTQAWNNIKCAFPENNYSSRIIATTRIVDVAKSCCSGTGDHIYEMKALSGFHSRNLFFKSIFGSNVSCPDMMIEVSSNILKKCGGLPLAIISISGFLANKPVVKEEWENVARSIGSAMENNRSLEGMSSILSLSYNDLPPNLKTCLMYLSVFLEDYFIERERLVQRWIAEGFISKERGQSQYEVAESYFYDLINKNIVQPGRIGLDGKVSGCRVHDMMLEIIIITKSLEDNFITVIGGGQTKLSKHHGIIRRLSIQYIDQELAFALANEDLSHVRSLTVTASDCIKYLPNLAEFEALRVLDFEDCNGLEQYDMNSGHGHSLECLESWSPMPSTFQMFHMYSSNYLRKVPKWIEPSLASLSSLDINLTELTEDDLHTLGELPSLLELSLALTGQDRITVQGIGFPSLKTFQISSDIGTRITFVRGAMPRLEILELSLGVFSARNNGFCVGIMHLPCLKEVYFHLRSWDDDENPEIQAVVDAMKEEKTGNEEEKSSEDGFTEGN